MSRRFLLMVWAAGLLAEPRVLPPRMGEFNLVATPEYAVPEPAVFREYTLELAERCRYVAGRRQLEITLLRAKDPTGAFGIYQWLRPRDARPADPEQGERSVQKDDSVLFQYGNYVMSLRGDMPEQEHLDALLSILPRYERTAAPPVAKFLPPEGLVPNSERFIAGPVSLARLVPAIPPSTVAFHLGAEGQFAEYAAEGGRLALLVFYYPTPQMSRAQLEEFHKLPKLVAKRSGPLIAAVVNPFSRDEAEKLLARVRYEATLTWSQPRQQRSENIGEFLLGVVLLCLILIGFAIVAGLGVSGVRILLGRWFPRLTQAEAPFIRLKLSDR